MVKCNKAIGIETKDGKVYEAKYIVSNVDVKTTFLKLIDEDEQPTEILNKIKNIKARGVSFKIPGIKLKNCQII